MQVSDYTFIILSGNSFGISVAIINLNITELITPSIYAIKFSESNIFAKKNLDNHNTSILRQYETNGIDKWSVSIKFWITRIDETLKDIIWAQEGSVLNSEPHIRL